MKCNLCKGKTMVLEKRVSLENEIVRRRKCLVCGHRFSTQEIIYNKPIMINKPIKIKIQKVKKPIKKRTKKIKKEVIKISEEKQNLLNLWKKEIKI